MSTSSHLHKRQNLGGYGGYDGRYSDSFWYTNSGYATRYGITAAIILLIFGYFIGGWLHGKARLRKNKPLLAYHRWMFRSSRNRYSYSGRPYYANQNGPGQSYMMNSYGQQHGPPVYRPGQDQPDVNGPPAYNPADVPPAYVPPPGSKVAPQQQYEGQQPQYDGAYEEGGASSSHPRPADAVIR